MVENQNWVSPRASDKYENSFLETLPMVIEYPPMY